MKGIPPKHDDRWAEEKGADKKKADKATLQVNLSVSSCVKLFVRPPAVKGRQVTRRKIDGQNQGNKLKGNNPTPFYINISELSVGGKEVKEHRYISPLLLLRV
ncbi:hypothetical protein PY721_07860 [Escherichia coli]|uniref:hypothetical protein n=1 Tax=Escherichia coli TaxID=562 RepID=UPI00263BD00F|nr:hypothetical protein [Escherichia coli]WKB91778.1 hypothetical protein PY721_07860 [Escherichia coli]